MMKLKHKIAAVLALSGAITASSSAALSVTNGGFGTNNQNGGTVDGGGWFESGTDNWVDGTWTWVNGANVDATSSGDTALLLMDGSGSIGYIYQSLGTVDAGEIALGTLAVTADFAEKSDGSTNTAVFDFYVGAFGGAATGVDIDANLTSQATIALDAVGQGSTAAAGDNARHNGVAVGTFDISGLTAGDEVWIRLTELRPGGVTTGDLIVDNLSVNIVPEPSSAALLGLGGLALILRRRK
ncbi:MAG: PEP-CTERM sorting domain-containing protein [Akkermansiaceae bacterium]|nr:PEP-CTERM sorting domain-containing protein [Akkermansiaceae bacterium]